MGKLKTLKKCTNIRIDRLEREIAYLRSCIDVILGTDKDKIAMLITKRNVERELENAIFLGNGKNDKES